MSETLAPEHRGKGRTLVVPAVLLLGGAALGYGVATWDELRGSDSQCTSVQFATPKGGPNSAQINVYPLIRGQLVPTQFVHGVITEGANAGTGIAPGPDNRHGQLQYLANSADGSPRQSVITVSGQFDGKDFTCPPQPLTFDPGYFVAQPEVPEYPPF